MSGVVVMALHGNLLERDVFQLLPIKSVDHVGISEQAQNAKISTTHNVRE